MAYLNYFTKTEWALWLSSVLAILISALLFGKQAPLALIASLIGVTSLIFSAKANPIGQGLVIIFFHYLCLSFITKQLLWRVNDLSFYDPPYDYFFTFYLVKPSF